MFGLIRIILILVIIAAVALLIRPDLIELTGLTDSKPPRSEEKAVAAPVVEQPVSETAETAATAETATPNSAENAAQETPISEKIAPQEPAVPQQSDTPAESDATPASAPAHDPETLEQSKAEWGFDSSAESSPAAESAAADETSAPQDSAGSATEADPTQEQAPAHDPETLQQSKEEWGFDGTQESQDADNAAPEASDTPRESETEKTDSTPDEAALRREVAELQALAADIIDNPNSEQR
jgi:hypothetical protein